MVDELHRRGTWPARTARLALRPAVASDWEATWRYRRLPEVGRWLTSAATDPDAYRGAFVDPTYLSRTLVVLRGDDVVGDVMVKVVDAWTQAEVTDRGRRAEAELGWVIDPAHQGQGLATEAMAEVLRLCFEDLGLRRVVAMCFAANEASWRLMERLGMRREGSDVRASLHRTEGWLDGCTYALLADEWRTQRAEG